MSIFNTFRRKAQEKYNTHQSRKAYEQAYPDEARKELADQRKLQASRDALKAEKRAALTAKLGRIASAISGPTQRAVKGAKPNNSRTQINPAFDTSSGNIFTRENTFSIGTDKKLKGPFQL
jgi:hypothetical protein